jgi:hypothetical protein
VTEGIGFGGPLHILKYLPMRFAGMGETAGERAVEALLDAQPEPVRSLAHAIRSAALAFGGVAEKMIVDYDVPEDSPAFYVGARQLCHAHLEKDRVNVTVSLGRDLTFEVLRAKDVPEGIRGLVDRTKEYGATRWVAVAVTRPEDVEGLVALLRRKHAYLAGGADDLVIPRDQTTLEKFA